MFNRLFEGPVGKASLASVLAMATFVALSTQMHVTPAIAASPAAAIVELA